MEGSLGLHCVLDHMRVMPGVALLHCASILSHAALASHSTHETSSLQWRSRSHLSGALTCHLQSLGLVDGFRCPGLLFTGRRRTLSTQTRCSTSRGAAAWRA